MAASPRIVAAGFAVALALLVPAASMAGAQASATLQVSPSSGGRGTVVSVVGNGFVPCLSFTVRWDSPRMTVTGDPASHTASFTVPEGAAGGSHTVTANCDPVAAGGAGPLQIGVAYFDVIAPPAPVDPAPVTGPAPPPPPAPAPAQVNSAPAPPPAAAPPEPAPTVTTTVVPSTSVPASDFAPAPARRPLRRVDTSSDSDFPVAWTMAGLALLVLVVLVIALGAIRFARRRAGGDLTMVAAPAELPAQSMPGHDLAQVADDLLSGIDIAPLAAAGPASARLARACPDEAMATPLLATLLWESFVNDHRFAEALREAGASDRALEEGRVLVVRHAGETRHDLLVLDPGFPGANPSAVSVDLEPSAASALDRMGDLSWDALVRGDVADLRAPISEATIGTALQEAADMARFGLIVARQPQELLTYCPSPAWPVRARGDRAPIATAGAVVEGPDGSLAVTTSAHAVAGRSTVSVAGAVGTVTRTHGATDSCLVSVDDLPLNSRARGRSGPLQGLCPPPNDHVSFEGITSGVTSAQVIGWDIGILALDRVEGSRVYTTPETVPGDSGAALVDSADHILGFATCRSAFGQPIEYSAWVWADQVLRALGARTQAPVAAAAATEPRALEAPLALEA